MPSPTGLGRLFDLIPFDIHGQDEIGPSQIFWIPYRSRFELRVPQIQQGARPETTDSSQEDDRMGGRPRYRVAGYILSALLRSFNDAICGVFPAAFFITDPSQSPNVGFRAALSPHFLHNLVIR